jgi:hypothetical protein
MFILLIIFQIDFVAHDELPYGSGNSTDIYADLKAVSFNRFLGFPLAAFKNCKLTEQK